MTIDKNRAVFNLKAVVQETGIKPDTLRAWERRYGVPSPARTESGRRLYTARDVEKLKWLVERQAEGFSISQAIALLKEIANSGGDVAATAVAQDSQLTDNSKNLLAETHAPYRGANLDMAAEAWVSACLSFDEQAADAVLSSSFAVFPVETVVRDVLQTGIAAIGEGWHVGRITVQQEHFASGLAMRKLGSLLASTPPPSRQGRILVACPTGEFHTFSPLILTLLLRRRGWDVVNLGADVPVESLALTVKTTSPRLVVMAAQQLHTAVSLLHAAEAVRQVGVPLAFGGVVFNVAKEATGPIPGHFLGTDMSSAVRAIEQLMTAPASRSAQREVTMQYRDALREFKVHQPRIDADVWQDMKSAAIPSVRLAEAISLLGRDLSSALALGDIHILDGNAGSEYANTVDRLLPGMAQQYLQTYRHACRAHLSGEIGIVLEWLDEVVGASASESRVHITSIPADFAHRRTNYAHTGHWRNGNDWQSADPQPSRGRTQRNGTHA